MKILNLLLVLAAAFSTGCAASEAPEPRSQPGKPAARPRSSSTVESHGNHSESQRESPRELTLTVLPPSQVSPPARISSTRSKAPVISFTVQSDKPHSTPEKARLDALEMARAELMRQLQRLEPPVYARPSLTKISSEFIRRDSERIIQPTDAARNEWRANKLDPNRVWVQLDVELTEAQVQNLRSGDRVNDGLRGAAVLLAVLAVLYGFLRLDAWSRGYLTSWLAIGGVAAIVITTLLLFS